MSDRNEYVQLCSRLRITIAKIQAKNQEQAETIQHLERANNYQADEVRKCHDAMKSQNSTIQQLRDALQLTSGYLDLDDPHEKYAFNEARRLFAKGEK
jgi:hypothetical protein